MEYLTDRQIQQLIDGVYDGELTLLSLPVYLVEITSSNLMDAASSGFGITKGRMEKELFEAFRKNIFYFSAHKTKHEIYQLNKLLNLPKGKFVEQALKVDKQFNRDWLMTEYNTSRRLARSGREWLTIEEEKEHFPYLEYEAVMDENTREDHRKLDGVVKEVSDPFWNIYFPPLDWNCRCRVKKRATAEVTQKVDPPKVHSAFQHNVAKSKELWSKRHPYFRKLSKKAEKHANEMAEGML